MPLSLLPELDRRSQSAPPPPLPPLVLYTCILAPRCALGHCTRLQLNASFSSFMTPYCVREPLKEREGKRGRRGAANGTVGSDKIHKSLASDLPQTRRASLRLAWPSCKAFFSYVKPHNRWPLTSVFRSALPRPSSASASARSGLIPTRLLRSAWPTLVRLALVAFDLWRNIMLIPSLLCPPSSHSIFRQERAQAREGRIHHPQARQEPLARPHSRLPCR